APTNQPTAGDRRAPARSAPAAHRNAARTPPRPPPSCRTLPSLFPLLDVRFQGIEALLPELAMPGEPAFRLTQRRWLESIDALLGVLANLDQPRFAEDAQMLGDRWTADPEVARELARRALVLCEQLDDPPPCGICKCLEHLHRTYRNFLVT